MNAGEYCLKATALISAFPLLLGTQMAASAQAQEGYILTENTNAEEIVVTGSRITFATGAPVPIARVDAEDLMRTGQTVLGDILNDLPSLRSTLSQSNSSQYVGTAGLNLLDLRGLGTPRTLVLVNNRRHITAIEGEFEVDINTIPTELLERVDIVTGGSSAIYGSDAMAGVVNFVLRRDFEGASVNAQGGLAGHGDRGTYRLAGVLGRNFAGGRGNIAVSVEYSRSEQITFTDRPKLTGADNGRRQFQLVDSPAEDNTIPDRKFLTGIRSFGYANGGAFVAYDQNNINACSRSPGACLPNGFPRIFLFERDGSLREADYGVDFRPFGSGNNQGGDGAILNDAGSLRPRIQRHIANLVAHYDVSAAFKPFIEAKFVRVDAFAQGLPTFSQGGPQGLDEEGNPVSPFNYYIYTPISLDNAYLTSQSRALIQSLLPAGSTFFALNRNNLDLGTRDEANRRETYRVVAGAEGTFADDWRYDLSVTYGHLKTRSRFFNNRIERNFYNAIDAVRNSAGEIVCRVNQIAITDPSCVPINLFGEYQASQAALDYISTTSQRHGSASQLDIGANLAGDSSRWFVLPGGPARFAIGAEYRRETASYAYDELVTKGATFLNAIPAFNPPSFEVTEAFAEIELPILRELPFAEMLSVSGAARIADYRGAVGTVWAFNYGGTYSPIADIQFRANYSRSVRAPTLGDLYSSPSQNYQSLDDPCDANFINKGASTRPANCAAAGIPAGFRNFEAQTAMLEIISGGNANLKAERSRSITFGATIRPRFFPGLNLSVDYYDIRISRVITQVDAQTILDGCYDSENLENAFCQLIFPRDPDYTFANPALLQSSLNFASQRAKGIGAELVYNHRFDSDRRFQLRFVGNWVKARTDYPFVDNPGRPNRIKGELGDPVYAFNISAEYNYKNLMLGYQLRHIGKQSIAEWEAQHTTYGVPPLDPYYADRIYYPPVSYHNIRFSADVDERFTFYGGVDNLTDRMPPLGVLGTGRMGDGDAIYDNTGRFFYAGIRVTI